MHPVAYVVLIYDEIVLVFVYLSFAKPNKERYGRHQIYNVGKRVPKQMKKAALFPPAFPTIL